MKRHFSLAGLNWELVGTKPYYWKLDRQMEQMKITQPEEKPVPAPVPGSVQQALFNAGILPDWNIGTNYRQCEWVENRHWLYFLDLPDGIVQHEKNERVNLCFLGLDNCGEIWLNGQLIGDFETAYHSYCFDITDKIQLSNNRLCILFTSPERYEGQVYWTSRTQIVKPRFYYNWDWCPRIVQTGIWDDLFIEITDDYLLPDIYTYTELLPDLTTGVIHIRISGKNEQKGDINICLSETDGRIITEFRICSNKLVPNKMNCFTVNVPNINRWNINNQGSQTLYNLRCTSFDPENNPHDQWQRPVGFRCIEWKSCANASPEATPWLCCINGIDTFLQGVNWTPLRVLFADVDESLYRERLLQYKELGFNILRVWGGAILEKECFYRLCDEFGLLVWQEFPLSSSGINNTPPDDSERIGRMKDIVDEYILRRHYHPSLVIWSGGNELYDETNEHPLNFEHAMLKAIARTVEEKDPFHRLLPASPSGPVIYNDPKHYGHGIQWDVHGPWTLPEEPIDKFMSNIRSYWQNSDALLHSEAGVNGASPVSLIKRYCGSYQPLPISVDNPIWAQFSWWMEEEAFRKAHQGNAPVSIEEYVEWSQERQCYGLSIALTEAKHRFPACGGFLIWMGHDCFPCPSNTSIIDYEGNLKPVAQSFYEIMKSKTQNPN